MPHEPPSRFPIICPLPPPPPDPRSPLTRRLPAITLISVLAIGSFLYRVLVVGNLEQSSAMFIGLPLILAVLMTFLPTSRTITGSILKGITIFLLLLGVLLIEGVICILMAAPIFYLIGVIVGLIADAARVRKDMERFRVIVLLPLAFMSLEGITGSLSFNREEIIDVSATTALTVAESTLRLEGGPSFALQDLPAYLKMGFPRPTEVRGHGLAIGDTWTIHFSGGEGKPGDLSAKVTTSEPGHYIVERTIDSSHISHWLDWKSAEWTIEPTATGSTVHLRMRYSRQLDPAWYFKPIERYGVRLAGEYFLEQTFEK